MKKIMILLGVLMLAVLCTACAAREENTDNDGKVKIVTTIFPQYDFAREIAGDLADVSMLLSPGEETHTYDPTPADIMSIQDCDIFIYGGGESDTWADDVLKSMDTENMHIIAMMDLCSVLEEETVEGMQDDEHEHNDVDSEYDEHVWTSPVNAMKIVSGICDVLCQIDPDNARTYKVNTEAYLEKLEALDSEFRDIVDNSEKNTLIFGDRFPLLYFVREYGLDYYAAFPGCASNTEPSAETVAFLVDKVREENIPIVFKVELSNGQTAETIASDSGVGARVETFYSCHTISKDDFQAGEGYISIMSRNFDTLKEALG